jgi:hypothetical protein
MFDEFIGKRTASYGSFLTMQGHAVDYKDAVPQSQPLDERQVANNAGGFSFQARLMSVWMGCHALDGLTTTEDTAELRVQASDIDRCGACRLTTWPDCAAS